MSPQPESRRSSNENTKTTVSFTINGKRYTVGPEVPPWTLLVDFLREEARLTGTKVLCREGGCGICTVVITRPDYETEGGTKTHSINSCLIPVYSCDGWQIVTVESLGDRFDGYHPLQTALQGFAGTQCGYCTPGMVMSMYGQMKNGKPTMSQVERSLDGNLCRCTGYRPILDAFKALSVDASTELKEKLVDIEEAYKGKCKKTNGEQCNGCSKNCSKGQTNTNHQSSILQPELRITSAGIRWYRPTSVEGIYSIIRSLENTYTVRFVVGNTGSGVFKDDGPFNAYISTTGVPELYQISTENPFLLGANVSLTRAIEVFSLRSSVDASYAYLAQIAKHWQVIANTSVRNVGCWAGNLMLKHLHKNFQSDIFLTLLSIDAKLTIGNATDGKTTMMGLEEFMNTNMSGRVILSVTIPTFPADTKLRTFKITPRAVNAHAYVNAGFRMLLDPSDGHRVINKPVIALGGISQNFVRATLTEEFLTNKRLSDEETVRQAVQLLGTEVIPEASYQDASPQYRRSLSQALLFKAIVGFLGDKVSSSIQSAANTIERPISSGQQHYDMDGDIWPIGEPIPKIESATQISGEARYMADIPALPDELHAALVLTTVANARIKSIDATEALKQPGVVSWVSKEDIPGQNNFIVLGIKYVPKYTGPYPVFVSDRVKYAGQPVGIIVAENRDTAVRASKLVNVEYEDIKKPILSIKESIAAGRCRSLVTDLKLGDFVASIQQAPCKLEGEVSMGTQFHLPMEPFAARVIPTEDGYDVYCTTQWPTETQITTAAVLNVPNNSINVTACRLGGGFGSKGTRPHILSTAAAVAARKLKRPVRLVADLTSNMSFSGWREPYHMKYEVGFTTEGNLTALKVDNTCNVGHIGNESNIVYAGAAVQNAYSIPNVTYNTYTATTDTAANCYARCPGVAGIVSAMENVIEHVAHFLKKDPLEIRELNLAPLQAPRLLMEPVMDDSLKEILPLLKDKADFCQRKQEVEDFNTVAQVAAQVLQIPLDKVVIKATDTMIGSNSSATVACCGSELCCLGVKMASLALRKRLDAIEVILKEETEENPTWTELVHKAHSMDVDLSERYWTNGKDILDDYDVVGATCLEVELDVLTGVYMIRRADIMEDCGRSLSPLIDIGQVEGSFIMGLGLHTSEEMRFNPETGQKLSTSTWGYKPPTAFDIPADLRITLLPNKNTSRAGVLGSKITGEPPLCMSYAVITALRQAISSFRADNGNTDWFEMNTPVTVEKAQQLCDIRPEQFRLFADINEKLRK